MKKALGLESAKGCYSGAAPISTDTLNYFASLDIPVYEGINVVTQDSSLILQTLRFILGYGMSECSGAYSMCSDDSWIPGTVGKPMPGTIARTDSDTGPMV